MSETRPLQNQFNGGMKRDGARNRMAQNTAWNMVDLIPDYDAPARERGGWTHASSSVSAVTSTASYIRGGIYSAFSPTAGEVRKNLCIDEDGLLYSVTEAGVVSLIGSARTIAQNPIFHGGAAASAATAVYTGLVIIPDSTLAAVPKKYNGTTLSDLGGSPPFAKFATVYKDYTALGNGKVSSITYPNRLWFSPAGDPDCGFSGSVTAWDTTDAWQDFSLPILGLASTKSAILVFHSEHLSRMRGNTPPPDEDMVVDDPFIKVGLLDPFSIVEDEDLVYWCAPEGVFRTDGVSLDNISLKGGMQRYWFDLQISSTTAYTYSAGIIRGNLFICVMNGTSFVDAFMINLSTYAWYRMSNMDAVSFWSGLYGNGDELYFGRRGDALVGRMDTVFQVDNSAYKNDGNGIAVASVLETPFYELGAPGLKVVNSVFPGYTLTDLGSDDPSIAVSVVTTPDDTSYTSIGTLTENGGYTRPRVEIGGRYYGIGLKFVRSGAGDFRGYDLAAVWRAQEGSKR